jgi:hypothetical protein
MWRIFFILRRISDNEARSSPVLFMKEATIRVMELRGKGPSRDITVDGRFNVKM